MSAGICKWMDKCCCGDELARLCSEAAFFLMIEMPHLLMCSRVTGMLLRLYGGCAKQRTDDIFQSSHLESHLCFREKKHFRMLGKDHSLWIHWTFSVSFCNRNQVQWVCKHNHTILISLCSHYCTARSNIFKPSLNILPFRISIFYLQNSQTSNHYAANKLYILFNL